MTRRFLSLIALLAAAASPAAAQDQTAPADALQVTRTNGDWQTVCVNGEAPCFIRQIGKTEDGREIMEMSVRKIPAQQTQQGTVEALINIRVPLGVLLQPGVSLQIDSGEVQRGVYLICAAEGCLLREPLPNALVDALKKGVRARTTFTIPNNSSSSEVAADISLSGFTAAFNALEP